MGACIRALVFACLSLGVSDAFARGGHYDVRGDDDVDDPPWLTVEVPTAGCADVATIVVRIAPRDDADFRLTLETKRSTSPAAPALRVPVGLTPLGDGGHSVSLDLARPVAGAAVLTLSESLHGGTGGNWYAIDVASWLPACTP